MVESAHFCRRCTAAVRQGRLGLLINNLDKPGFIGALGTILSEANINIATLHLGRQAAAQDAIVGVDQVVHEPIQQKLRALPHVRYVKVLKF